MTSLKLIIYDLTYLKPRDIYLAGYSELPKMSLPIYFVTVASAKDKAKATFGIVVKANLCFSLRTSTK